MNQFLHGIECSSHWKTVKIASGGATEMAQSTTTRYAMFCQYPWKADPFMNRNREGIVEWEQRVGGGRTGRRK